MATSNRIRALNRLPFDFEDGLKVGGVDVTALNQTFTPAGAGLVGFTPVGNLSAGNVQAALAELESEKVGFARLDDTDGSSLVGYDGGTVQDVLDSAKPMADYTALRAYTGRATSVRITSNGLAGFFYRDDADTASADNGGTIIVAVNGKRWKRLFDGAVNVKWFGAKGNGADDESLYFSYAVSTGKTVFVPAGTYKASFDLGNNQIIFGEGGKGKTVVKPPSAAQYVIKIDATVNAKQHCQIRDLTIQNIDSVTGCVGILFKGTSVSTINDWHCLRNIYIVSFDRGIEILGRQIWSSYYNVEIVGGRIAFNVSTDTTTPAFNQNTFIQCRFSGASHEGIKIIGQNTTLGFYTCDFELCNGSNTAGLASVYIETSEQASFIGCYWESNGTGVPVDNVTLVNNSVGIRFAGSYCYNPKIEQAYFVGSGILVWVSASVRGGCLANSRLNALAGGYALYVSSSLSSVTAPSFTYESSNFTSSLILCIQDGNGNYACRVNQSTSCFWMTTSQTIDLTQMSKLVVNPNGTTFTGITTINNRLPGMELWVWNENNSGNSFTIDSNLIYKGSGIITPQTGKRYMVGGYPANGKLIEM